LSLAWEVAVEVVLGMLQSFLDVMIDINYVVKCPDEKDASKNR
jgi:hypothetical protein